ncbi:MAG TPA: hypothetical protein DEA96_08600 [Leptospiraceae bacterium]|nr:hypothetical protein [Spirochaetaceae bacterium]HBS05009.1 hypothetical protein [Leptospiraceae bacterium]
MIPEVLAKSRIGINAGRVPASEGQETDTRPRPASDKSPSKINKRRTINSSREVISERHLVQARKPQESGNKR